MTFVGDGRINVQTCSASEATLIAGHRRMCAATPAAELMPATVPPTLSALASMPNWLMPVSRS